MTDFPDRRSTRGLSFVTPASFLAFLLALSMAPFGLPRSLFYTLHSLLLTSALFSTGMLPLTLGRRPLPLWRGLGWRRSLHFFSTPWRLLRARYCRAYLRGRR